MTFLQEEEVFPTVTDSDASEKVEDSSKLSVSVTSLKDEANEANNTNVVADGKRKLSDKEADKKVSSLCPSYLYQCFTSLHFSYFRCFHLEMSTSYGRQMTSPLMPFCFRKLINLLTVGLN